MVDSNTHQSILRLTDKSYPEVFVYLEGKPNALERNISTKLMREIEFERGWESYNLNNPSGWFGVRRYVSLLSILHEEDHIAAIKHFFIESIHRLREELTEFKKTNPELPWNGGS